jgi:DNA (cytosine-5)-methyltransferase 1
VAAVRHGSQVAQALELDLFGADGEGRLGLPAHQPEEFHLEGSSIVRSLYRRDGTVHRTALPAPTDLDLADLSAVFDAAWLRSRKKPQSAGKQGARTIVDLFSGCGGLTLGVSEACNALDLRPDVLLALDTDPVALNVFAKNFPDSSRDVSPIESLLEGALGDPLTEGERRLKASVGQVDLALGGPPCQGHSDLNNHTRRDDPKNSLYDRMARFAEVVQPEHMIIENVPGVVHDRSGVVARTWAALRRLGYFVEGGVVTASEVGVPQRRKRFVTIASRSRSVALRDCVRQFSRPVRTVRWAIGDLRRGPTGDVFDSAARHSPNNVRRIDFLFDNDLYELPDEHRPDCHRLKRHSYRSVYGRMLWDEPAPTITGGFGSTGQGRFVHPEVRRTLTPHEAARMQFFPDYFDFSGVQRSGLQTLIGNAVPSKLAYVVAVELLR